MKNRREVTITHESLVAFIKGLRPDAELIDARVGHHGSLILEYDREVPSPIRLQPIPV